MSMLKRREKVAARLAMVQAAVDAVPRRVAPKDHTVIEVDPHKTRMTSIHQRLAVSMSGAAIDDLKESIGATDQVQPALGYYLDEVGADGAEVELIYGARRRAACMELARPLKVRVIERPTVLEVVKIIHAENRARRDYTPLEDALEFKKSREVSDRPDAEIGAVLGMKKSYVSKLSAILELPPEVLKLFEGAPELLPLTVGYELSIECRKTDVRQRVVEAALRLAEQPKPDPAKVLIEAAATAVPKRASVPDNTPIYVGKNQIGQVTGLHPGADSIRLHLTKKAPPELKDEIRKLILKHLEVHHKNS